MGGSVRGRRRKSVFTEDQRDDLRSALDEQYEELLPILEKAVAGYRTQGPFLEDTIRANSKAGKKLAASCRRFLNDLDALTPRWREVEEQPFGPRYVDSAERKLSALNLSQRAVECLLEDAQAWEEIGQRRHPRRPGKQVERRFLLAKYVGFRMMCAGIRLTKHAYVKKPKNTAESRARARLKSRGTSTTADPDRQDLEDFAVIGAAKIARGAVRFAQWSSDMIAAFGEAIRPHLAAIHTRARAEAATMTSATTVIQGGGKFTKTLKVVYEVAGEPVKDLYPDVARVIKSLKGLQELLKPNELERKVN